MRNAEKRGEIQHCIWKRGPRRHSNTFKLALSTTEHSKVVKKAKVLRVW